MIPVVFICDENYAMPTAVAITSLIMNKKKTTEYDIIVISNQLSAESENKLKKAGNGALRILKQYDNYEGLFKHSYVSPVALYKFEISNILSEYDKVIYLDSDVIINSDLTKLYEIELKECYAGVVKDFYSHLTEHDNLRLGRKVYFNSGVMLLNLKKMREYDIPKKLFEEKRVNLCNKYMDQDVLNIILGDKVKLISPVYNFMLRNKEDLEKFYEVYGEEPSQNNVIVHITPIKPWQDKECLFFRLWYKYYKKSPYKNTKLPAFRNARIKLRQNIINSFFKFFGYKISRIVSEVNKYKFLIEQKGYVVNSLNNTVFIPIANITLNYADAADLKEIYEIFIQEKFGLALGGFDWTVVDIGNSCISAFYFAKRPEVAKVLVCYCNDIDTFASGIKQNSGLYKKIELYEEFPNISEGKLIYKISDNTKSMFPVEKLSEQGLLNKADIIIIEWQGFSFEVIKSMLLKYGYKLFYKYNDAYSGIITAVK